MSGVVRARFVPERTLEEIDQQIARMQAYFSAKQLGVQWLSGPSTRPTNLGERLEQHGFLRRGSGPGMAVELERLPREPTRLRQLEIVRVSTTAQLKEWI